MMGDESQLEKIARIDANVTTLLGALPVIQQLDKDSAVNKREHRFAMWVIGLIATPVVLYFFKKLGVPIF